MREGTNDASNNQKLISCPKPLVAVNGLTGYCSFSKGNQRIAILKNESFIFTQSQYVSNTVFFKTILKLTADYPGLSGWKSDSELVDCARTDVRLSNESVPQCSELTNENLTLGFLYHPGTPVKSFVHKYEKELCSLAFSLCCLYHDYQNTDF